MCAFQEQNCMQSNNTSLADSVFFNMALMHSIQCVSDQVLSDCLNPKVENLNDRLKSDNVECNDNDLLSTDQKIFCEKLDSKDCKSFYKTKSCKYSFIASDYTSAEGQRLLNIKVIQKTPDELVSCGKNKHFLTKRSISEYFPSKNNGMENDVQSERVRAWSMMKAWQKTFFKSQVSSPLPIKELTPNKYDEAGQDVQSENPAGVTDTIPSQKRCDSLKDYSSNTNSDQNDVIKNMLLNSDESRSTQTHSGSLERNLVLKDYSLNPNVNVKVFDTESLSESLEACDPGPVDKSHFVLEDAWFIQSNCSTLGGSNISGSTSAAQLSIASSFGENSVPICKICHMGAKPDDPLISPCRCIGTLRYIHCACLMKWLEICSKKTRKPPTCELCKYPFHWHKKFKVGQWQFPHCSWQDKILHTVFIISLLVMIGCAVITVLCFKQHREAKTETHLELTQSEIITLICGALFFLAFFLAMYVEIKARNTLYRLMVKFIYLNQQWYIDEYNEKERENVIIDV